MWTRKDSLVYDNRGKEPMTGKLGRFKRENTEYLVQEVVGNQAHRGTLGLGKGGSGTLRGCKEVEESQRAGQEVPTEADPSKTGRKQDTEFQQELIEGLIQKHICQVPMAHVFGGFLRQQPEAKGESQL